MLSDSLITVCAQPLNRVWLFAAPWTVACQAPLPMEFSRQEYWSVAISYSRVDRLLRQHLPVVAVPLFLLVVFALQGSYVEGSGRQPSSFTAPPGDLDGDDGCFRSWGRVITKGKMVGKWKVTLPLTLRFNMDLHWIFFFPDSLIRKTILGGETGSSAWKRDVLGIRFCVHLPLPHWIWSFLVPHTSHTMLVCSQVCCAGLMRKMNKSKWRRFRSVSLWCWEWETETK